MTESNRNRDGFGTLEVIIVVAVVAILLATGSVLYPRLRHGARVCAAENRLSQVATALELYFRENRSYPPNGCDLTVELEPFINDPEAFGNPLMDEDIPGETVSKLYRQPTLDEIDTPNHYLTAMISQSGGAAVILKTGNKIERREGLRLDPAAPADDLLALLDDEPDRGGDPGDADEPDGDDGPQDISYVVQYDIVRDGPTTVKFEGAPVGLGEDRAQETDQYVITLSETSGGTILVTTKAGTVEDTSEVSLENAEALDAIGFDISLQNVDDNIYTFALTSRENESALSFVEFDFGEGSKVESADPSVVRTAANTIADADAGSDDSEQQARPERREPRAKPQRPRAREKKFGEPSSRSKRPERKKPTKKTR